MLFFFTLLKHLRSFYALLAFGIAAVTWCAITFFSHGLSWERMSSFLVVCVVVVVSGLIGWMATHER